MRDLQEQANNREVANQVLHDELQALQLELMKREDRTKELEAENQRMLEKLITLLNNQADKLDEEANNQYADPRRGGSTGGVKKADATPAAGRSGSPTGSRPVDDRKSHRQRSITSSSLTLTRNPTNGARGAAVCQRCRRNGEGGPRALTKLWGAGGPVRCGG